jgi:hypothetical protein
MIRYIAPMEIRIRPGKLSREALLLMLLANPGRPMLNAGAKKPRR